MRVWVTKYALSGGIVELDTEVSDSGYARDNRPDAFGWIGYAMGKDAFDSEVSAKADARLRRDKKIASLQTQIRKLQRLEF